MVEEKCATGYGRWDKKRLEWTRCPVRRERIEEQYLRNRKRHALEANIYIRYREKKMRKDRNYCEKKIRKRKIA
jgi:hypothetical protein